MKRILWAAAAVMVVGVALVFGGVAYATDTTGGAGSPTPSSEITISLIPSSPVVVSPTASKPAVSPTASKPAVSPTTSSTASKPAVSSSPAGGGLPVTGAPVGGLVLLGLGVAVAGFGLLAIARRRRFRVTG